MAVPWKFKKAIKFARAGALFWLLQKKLGLKKPHHVQIVPLLKCNLNCRKCHQKDARQEQKNSLSLEDFRILIENLKKYGVRKVSMLGGEIFLMPEIWKILDLFEQRGVLFDLGTNGVLLNDESIKRLSKYNNLVNINISIDGFSETHDYLRGFDGAWNKTLVNVLKMKKVGMNVGVVSVVQKENLKEISSFIRFLYLVGLKDVSIILEANTTKQEIIATRAEINNLDCLLAKGELSCNYEDLKVAVEDLKKLKRLKGFNLELPVHFYRLENYYNKRWRKEYTVDCPFMNKEIIQVDCNGRMTLCTFLQKRDFPELTKPLSFNPFNLSIFNEVLARSKKTNLFPLCNRCCSIRIAPKPRKVFK